MNNLAGVKLVYKPTQKAHRITIIGKEKLTDKYVVWSNLHTTQLTHMKTTDYEKAYECYCLWVKRAHEENAEYSVQHIFY